MISREASRRIVERLCPPEELAAYQPPTDEQVVGALRAVNQKYGFEVYPGLDEVGVTSIPAGTGSPPSKSLFARLATNIRRFLRLQNLREASRP
jgi:hypothetical protein